MEIRARETEKEKTIIKNQVHALDIAVLELRSENLKLKLGTCKEIASDTYKKIILETEGDLDLETLHLNGISKASTSHFLRIRFALTVSKDLVIWLPNITLKEDKIYGTGPYGSVRTNEDSEQMCIGLCAKFQANPKESYLKVVKRILRYLKGTTDFRLMYPKGSNFDLVRYADYEGFLVDKKSTSGMAHFFGSSLVSWAVKKQNYVALSTAEAEYVVVASCCV
ncbi:PREDICTED: uncharacterized protein LOC109214501 [Nicotiana attenuata]|uniref:uncharacterized protein LOC109214501 n=1 Tax=Nicotiana attenuata TaxID=49451 RepID=UPI000905B982|nr:PREDICTED: uncharacterized protein LOC109214501 [Nicotiana attenuata]